MIDFNERWGDGVEVLSENDVRGFRNRQKGIPFLCILGAALDPRFKSLIGIPEGERQGVWDLLDSMCVEAVSVVEAGSINDLKDNCDISTSVVTSDTTSLPKIRKYKKAKKSSCFDELTDYVQVLPPLAPKLSIPELIKAEIFHFRMTPPIPMVVDGQLSNPLLWWKENTLKFPYLSILARRILCIPATSAPSERIFSVAGRTISNERAKLLPENADMMVFLHDAYKLFPDLFH